MSGSAIDALQAERTLRGDLLGQSLRFALEIGVRDHAVHEPRGDEIRRWNEVARIEEILRALRADPPR